MVQIAGGNPEMMADAASYNISRGAQIIDINMGCPAKKICNVQAGSALLEDESIRWHGFSRGAGGGAAAGIPVTLKIRTGWITPSATPCAWRTLAENAGVAALAIHGRTRADQYPGEAKYDTIREVKHQRAAYRSLPTATSTLRRRRRFVLDDTGVDGIMIGRAAQGRPSIFREIGHYLSPRRELPPPTLRKSRRC